MSYRSSTSHFLPAWEVCLNHDFLMHYDFFVPLISGLLPDVSELFHFLLLTSQTFFVFGVVVDIQCVIEVLLPISFPRGKLLFALILDYHARIISLYHPIISP